MKFPLFVDIRDKKILVVGAGKIAAARIKTLSDFGAQITVVADNILSELDNVSLIKRKFLDEDIDSKPWLFVLAATNDREVNKRIGELCRARNIPVSVADSAAESTFFFPALCKNDSLCIGIVSQGSCHREVKEAAERIRREIL